MCDEPVSALDIRALAGAEPDAQYSEEKGLTYLFISHLIFL